MRRSFVMILLAILSLATAGCRQKNSEGNLPVIDVEAAIDNPQPFDLADIADSIEFIPLDDSRRESLIGGHIREIKESKNVWYVHDNVSGPVKLFDRAGNFLSTRGMIGRGPSELLSIVNTEVDWERDHIYLYGGAYNDRRHLVYDAAGKTLLVKETLCDTVFRYQIDMTLEPFCVFDLGRYAIPAEAVGANATVPWDDNFRWLIDVMEDDRYVFAVTAKIAPAYQSIYIFDKKDSYRGFLAVGPKSNMLFLDGIAFKPMYIRENRLVGCIQAFDIADNRDKITHPDLKAVAAAITEDSNPVIVVATLKK